MRKITKRGGEKREDMDKRNEGSGRSTDEQIRREEVKKRC